MSILGITSGGGGGSSPDPATVLGPASATDNAIARYDGTTGKLLQGSTPKISDAGNIELADTGEVRNSSGSVVIRFDSDLVTVLIDSVSALSVSGAAVVITSPATLLLGTANGPSISTGSGSPEGVVDATRSSIYLDQGGGGVLDTLYVKKTNSGNTGWSAFA